MSGCLSHIHSSHPSVHLHHHNQPSTITQDEQGGVQDGGVWSRAFRKWNVAWLLSIPAACLVGSTGVLPLLVFNSANCDRLGSKGAALSTAVSPSKLKLLLSFSVGGLFGDVFLHLLPESLMCVDRSDPYAAPLVGMWVIAGLVCFLLIEKVFTIHEQMNQEECPMTLSIDDHGTTDGMLQNDNGSLKHIDNNNNNSNNKSSNINSNENSKKIIGYLNLFANCVDNFTHGLAVSGSFIVSVPVGLCTTFAILLHEIPHEIADFAILLKAGFNRWEAAKGQLVTASGAVLGCVFGLMAESGGEASTWVLPFTSGGFIYISCVTILPDIVKETDWFESVKQIFCMFSGIALMAFVSTAHHH